MAIDTGGLTTDSLGDQLGVSGSTVRRWVMDQTIPKRAFLLQIALMTNVPADWLITGKIPEAVVAEQLEEESQAGRSDNPVDTDWLPRRIKKTSQPRPMPSSRKVA